MSKSLDNYVGVTDAPEEMFGRLMRVPDAAMEEYFRLLLGEEVPAGPPNEAKRELARRLVARYHGETAAAAAEEHFNRLFVDHEAPGRDRGGEPRSLRRDDGGQVHLPQLMGGLFEISSSEARRLIGQGGVKLDGETLPAGPLDYDPTRPRRAGLAGRKAPLPAPACRRLSRLAKGPLGAILLASLWEGPSGRPVRKSGESRRRGAAVFEN